MPINCSIKMWSSRSSSDFTFSKFRILLGPSATGLTKPTKFCTSLCQADCGSTRLKFPAKSLAKSHGIVESSDDSQRSSKWDMRIKNRFDKSWSFFSTAVQAISTASAASNLLRQPNEWSFPAWSSKTILDSSDKRLGCCNKVDGQWLIFYSRSMKVIPRILVTAKGAMPSAMEV